MRHVVRQLSATRVLELFSAIVDAPLKQSFARDMVTLFHGHVQSWQLDFVGPVVEFLVGSHPAESTQYVTALALRVCVDDSGEDRWTKA